MAEITTEAERGWLASQPEDLRGVLARVIFSAKEASYKALYPGAREVVGFDAMDIRPDPARGRFTATLNRRFGGYAAGQRLEGQVHLRDGLICTLMVLAEPAVRANRGASGPGVTKWKCSVSSLVRAEPWKNDENPAMMCGK